MDARRALANAGLVAGGVLAAALLGEVALRLLPIPGVRAFTYRYDPLVGYALYPGALVLWRGPGGQVVERRTNSLGFLDAEHPARKAPGTTRVGFFGDSYVEARQVPLEETFFRAVGRTAPGVEALAFGRSGFGTVGAWLLARTHAAADGIDLTVYVFCENDPGDNLREVRRDPHLPYAEPEGDGFRLVPPEAGAPGPGRRLLQAALRRSLLLANLAERVRLLAAHGVRVRPDEAERAMAGRARGELPDQNDLPSTWPAPLRARAERTAAAVLRRWREEEAAAGRRFAVLYIPREGQLGPGQDSWRSWLAGVCAAAGIAFIDPTPELAALERSGVRAFGDHLTRAGHAALARAFVFWLRGRGRAPAAVAGPTPAGRT